MEQNFQEITGASAAEAKMFLEMSGGNLETAISLFFEGGMSMQAPTPVQQPQGWQKPDWYTLVWPEKTTIAPQWLEQGFQFSTSENQKIGLMQPKNGPCGLLAAVNAVLITRCLERVHGFGLNHVITDEILADTLTTILKHTRPAGQDICRIARWTGPVGEAVETVDVSEGSIFDHFVKHISDFKSRGGAVLFLYSAILTRGVAQIKKELTADGSEPPLVTGPHWLCTSDLVSLFLCGVPKGNVSAYDPTTAELITWPGQGISTLGIGLLSQNEIETGVPITDALKTPKYPVWLIHGGDHFTILFSLSLGVKFEAGAVFDMYHWNGLPPVGPRMAHLKITAPKGQRGPNVAKYVATFYKPEAGEIDDVVQGHPEDRKLYPEEFQKWRFECVLAIDDPGVEGVKRPENVAPEPKFDQGEMVPGPWRCGNCYRSRYTTFCFGMNEGGDICQHCNKSRKEAGWSFWMTYDKLPRKFQRTVARRNAPKIMNILHTKWPDCEVGLEPGTKAPGC